MKNRLNKGFTLIELLIVVAIIAVLSAIAVPNFLEASTRSRVSRVNSDQRTLYMACETYCVDNNSYPPKSAMMMTGGWWQAQLTTPTSYLGAPCNDPFCREGSLTGSLENLHYQYGFCPMMKSIIFVSIGPDLVDNFDEGLWMCGMAMAYPLQYDPTNGSVSEGDIWRCNKQGGPIPQRPVTMPMGM